MSRAPKKRTAAEGDNPIYLAWIRTLVCCVCARPAPSHAHHSTLRRGMGQKSFDNETMPLCFRCHREFHDGTGWAEWATREDRRLWQTYQVQRCQQLYIELGLSDEVA